MGSFKLGKMTLRSLFKKPETILYPVETRPAPEDLKGSIEVDIKKCTLCQVCEKRCPTNSITVSKADETWSIDRFDCIQCRTCVRECPFHCLTMKPEYQKPAPSKSVATYKKPELTEEEKAELARKEAEKKERIRKAREAKAAREKAKQGLADASPKTNGAVSAPATPKEQEESSVASASAVSRPVVLAPEADARTAFETDSAAQDKSESLSDVSKGNTENPE